MANSLRRAASAWRVVPLWAAIDLFRDPQNSRDVSSVDKKLCRAASARRVTFLTAMISLFRVVSANKILRRAMTA
jgi:hypothetical protein